VHDHLSQEAPQILDPRVGVVDAAVAARDEQARVRVYLRKRRELAAPAAEVLPGEGARQTAKADGEGGEVRGRGTQRGREDAEWGMSAQCVYTMALTHSPPVPPGGEAREWASAAHEGRKLERLSVCLRIILRLSPRIALLGEKPGQRDGEAVPLDSILAIQHSEPVCVICRVGWAREELRGASYSTGGAKRRHPSPRLRMQRAQTSEVEWEAHLCFPSDLGVDIRRR